jgi:hypothetical protein
MTLSSSSFPAGMAAAEVPITSATLRANCSRVNDLPISCTLRRRRFFGQWDKLKADRSKEA